MSASPQERVCWCGHPTREPYSPEYDVCRACGTLVSRAPVPMPNPAPANDAAGDLYSKDYWTRRQTEHHGLPPIEQRARLDLPERCTHWLQHLLTWRLPPARVLEIGCGHGGFVALLGWAGYDAVGTEMSPWVVDFARRTFGVTSFAGPIETQPFERGSFDVIVLNDVLEHFETPFATMSHCVKLLRPDGFFVIQTPEYREHLSHGELLATSDLFLRHMENNNDEHVFLFSRRSAQEFFSRLGFGMLAFTSPVYGYDMYFTAARASLTKQPPDAVAAALAQRPQGRLVQALLDKAYESTDRWWAMQRLEAELRERSPSNQ
ncbi:MAG TPA: class I SAM-dependent methyltransferase [Candidatus Synoicihabitans sp.]|nr:class I SAM-dependent methyltransferase [Candidatus Synoicihabitans sp.]